MEELRLNNNQLSSSLPDELGSLLKLKTLHIEHNQLTGTLPESMKNLDQLEKLRLDTNNFSGAIPDGICLLRPGGTDTGSLEEFIADCDEFQPKCPCCTLCISRDNPAPEKADVHKETEVPTSAPTATPPEPEEDLNEPGSSDRLNQIKHRLVEDRITSPDLVHITANGDVVTPQRKALEWISDEDERKLAVTHDHLYERFALATFWFSTFDVTRKFDIQNPPAAGDPPLPNWVSTNNWMTSAPICSWYGVKCEEGNNADGAIDQFNATNNGIRGKVPQEFFKGLTDISVLDLSHNILTGSISEGVGGWENLRLLYLNQNFLTGTLPSTLFSPGHNSQLEIIDLGGNHLSGGIPDQIGDLSSLVRLALYENYLTGTISSFLANCKSLDTLYLDSNDLDGTIPPLILSQLTQLQDLRLRSNHLHGSIPPEINLPKLKLLYLDDNEMTGTVPDSIGSLARLEEVHLYKNKLTGSLPPSLGKLRYLKLLYVDSNELSSSIPQSFGDLHSLQQLFLFNNKLTGSIPDGIYGIEDVEELRLNDNALGSSIPSEIGELFKLKNLHLENNSFSGILPTELGNMDELEVLRVQNNQFSAPIPDELCLLRDHSLGEFVADCSKTSCSCCTECT